MSTDMEDDKMQYQAILTNEGLATLSTAQISDEKVAITSVVLGDGNGIIPTPNPTQTELINEVWRGVVSDVYAQDGKVVTTAVIGVEDGSFTIREIGILDANGTLIAVGNYPEKYKPTLLEGMAEELVIEFVIETDVAGVFELQIDPTIALASKAYVDKKTSDIELALTAHLDQEAYLVARTSADQSIANDTMSILSINTLVFGDGEGLVLGTDGSIQVTLTGDYEIEGSVQWDTSSNGIRKLIISNSSTQESGLGLSLMSPSQSLGTTQTVKTFIRLVAGTIIYLKAYQNSGSALLVVRNANTPYLSVKRLKKEGV